MVAVVMFISAMTTTNDNFLAEKNSIKTTDSTLTKTNTLRTIIEYQQTKTKKGNNFFCADVVSFNKCRPSTLTSPET